MNRPFVAPLIILLGTALIIACSTGTLWFDEILSFQWAKSAKNPWQLLELYRHDNNHPLNTLWLMLLGENRPPWAYRALSIVSGIVSLILIHRLAVRLSPRFAWVPLLLAATSFPLVLYFSEARGYAPAIACLLGAYATLTGNGRANWRVPLFWLLCILAILAHATALTILAAMGAASLFRGVFEKQKPFELIGSLSLWFGLPLFAAIIFLLFFLKEMMVAGGPEYPLPLVIAHLFRYAFGIPSATPGSMALAVAGMAIIGSALAFGKFPDPASRFFFIGAILVFPALSLISADTTFLYFRYFLVSLPFIYLLAGPATERLSQSSRLITISAVLLCVVSIIGQIPRIWTLATLGRGAYFDTFQKIASDSDPQKSIVSNNEMELAILLSHFRRRFDFLEPLHCIPASKLETDIPHWIVYTSQEDPPATPQISLELNGQFYNLVSSHLSAPVSGTHWTLYQIQPNTP